MQWRQVRCMKPLRDKPLLFDREGLSPLLETTSKLDFDVSPMSNHVAANLAKWWKTKFLNGYRQFTVVPTDCSDGRPSDTEELLGRHEYGTSNEKEVSEDKSDRPNQPPKTERRQLSFEEFECDVSVEGGVGAKGQERQEFSFTLYDFDGHGKITKDDIAGLVTTIYDTLGSTIKVPHYGSKTIKVKLTVSPDQRKRDAAAAAAAAAATESAAAAASDKCNNNTPSSPKTQTDNAPLKVKFKRDLNVTIRESRTPKRPHRRRRAPTRTEEKYVNSCSSSCRSGASENNEDCAGDASEEEEDDDEEDVLAERMLGKEFTLHSSPTTQNRRRRYEKNQSSPRCRAGNSPMLFQQRSKKRSSSLQREELLQIIQANMEKNNLCFQTSRKHCGDRSGLSDHRHSHHRHRHKPAHFEDSMAARVQLHYLSNPPASCYLDLAGLDTGPKNPRCYDQDCHYDKLLGAVVCASAKHASTGFHQSCCSRGHNRSRSHDLADPFRYHVLDPDLGVPGNRHSYADGMSPYGYPYSPRMRSKSHEDRKVPHFVLGHTSSPHHLKHRNREEDQARAMAQVVSWLEQEFSSSLNGTDVLNAKNLKTAGGSPNKTHKNDENKKDETPDSPTSSAEKHEHHHVHEHIHHHYHHYQETPVLV